MAETPGKITVEDTNLYEAYEQNFEPGTKVFWLKLIGTVVEFKEKAKFGMPPGYDLYLIKLDDVPTAARAKGVSNSGLVEAFRGHLRLGDSVAMHALVS